MRLIFMGTPAFAATALSALLAAGHEVCVVYCQPPRPAKRGQKEVKCAVQTLAESQGLEVRTPKNFKDAETCQDFTKLQAEAAVVAAYGLILPQAILQAPEHGCINIHASLLPRWRGAAPIHRAIEAGDDQTGISIMQMQRGLDTGPVLLTHSLDLDPLETTGSLHDKLADLGGDAILEALADLSALVPTLQDEAGVTYAAKIHKTEAPIDWTQPAERIARKIRALSPFPGAWFQADGQRIKVLNARAAAGGALNLKGVELLRLQRAGKKAQDVEEFLKGFDLNLSQIS